MKKLPAAARLLILFCLPLGVTACDITQMEHRRIVELSEPLDPGGSFWAKTHNGYISINGTDQPVCQIVATIKARAQTAEAAEELAMATTVSLVPDGNGLKLLIDKPGNLVNKSVGVSLDVKVPYETSAKLITHNGKVSLSGLTAPVVAETHNGGVDAENLTDGANLQTHNGTVHLRNLTGGFHVVTHNGGIHCHEISGKTYARTHNGKIELVYSDLDSGAIQAEGVTHNGSITLKTPPDISATIHASVHNGSIRSELPITVQGKIDKKKLNGTIGTGEGQIKLETHNGSIHLQ